MHELRVELGERSYPVYIGTGLLERAGELIGPLAQVEKVVLFQDVGEAAGPREDGILPAAGRLAKGLGDLGGLRICFTPDGERAKSVEHAREFWGVLADLDVHRNDVVVGFGGGAVSDLAGFVAATFNRGLPWVVVPTTLLAMVDASIGGKTGINLPQGKNLVGSFHQPLAVISDVTTLDTLPEKEVRTGMAEVIKHGLIANGALLGSVIASRDKILARHSETLEGLVAVAAAVKVRVVSEDEREHGARAFLNYGHTLGHALETLGGYERFAHGEAVAIGMMFAARLAASLGHADRVDDHRRALEAFDLPVSGAGFDYEPVAEVWRRDKKYEKGMRFILLEDVGKPVIARDVPDDALRRAYEDVR